MVFKNEIEKEKLLTFKLNSELVLKSKNEIVSELYNGDGKKDFLFNLNNKKVNSNENYLILQNNNKKDKKDILFNLEKEKMNLNKNQIDSELLIYKNNEEKEKLVEPKLKSNKSRVNKNVMKICRNKIKSKLKIFKKIKNSLKKNFRHKKGKILHKNIQIINKKNLKDSKLIKNKIIDNKNIEKEKEISLNQKLELIDLVIGKAKNSNDVMFRQRFLMKHKNSNMESFYKELKLNEELF